MNYKGSAEHVDSTWANSAELTWNISLLPRRSGTCSGISGLSHNVKETSTGSAHTSCCCTQRKLGGSKMKGLPLQFFRQCSLLL